MIFTSRIGYVDRSCWVCNWWDCWLRGRSWLGCVCALLTEIPRGNGSRVRPQTLLKCPRLVFGGSNHFVFGIFLVVPRHPFGHHLCVDESLPNPDSSDDALVAVSFCPSDSNGFSEDLCGKSLLGLGSECLATFGCVDVFEADFVLGFQMQDCDCVAICDANYLAREIKGIRVDWATEEEQKNVRQVEASLGATAIHSGRIAS